MIPGLIISIIEAPHQWRGGLRIGRVAKKKPPAQTDERAGGRLSLFASAPRPPTGDDGAAMGGAARRAGEVARFVAGVWVFFWSFPLATLAGWVRSFDVVRHRCDHLEW